MSTVNTGNYTISGVSLFFNTTIANASLNATETGFATFRNDNNSLGNIVAGEFTPDVTYVDHWVSVNGKRVKDKTVENVVALTINFTFDEMNVTNLEKYFLANSTGSVLDVMQNTTDEGSAIVYIHTDIGRDMQYVIPKCTIKPDGGLALNIEDWWTGSMMLEILQYQSSDGSNATWLAAPLGQLHLNYH